MVLEFRLREAIAKLNPELSSGAAELAVYELTKDRSVLSPVRANQEVYQLLKDGVKVTYRTSDDEESTEIVKIIDWENPENNDFFLASQFWISGDYGKKRADLVGFVNGIPLVFIELKASHRKLENAYKDNLSDYKTTIPQLFWYNAFVILSNGSKSRLGSMTAGWEHFAEWKKINDEGEEGVVSLETIIRGTCEKQRLLDLVENFTHLQRGQGRDRSSWSQRTTSSSASTAPSLPCRAQGEPRASSASSGTRRAAGKSYSMVFFSQKVLRKLPGNWTFVIVTDREDLDDQIYRNFSATGAVIEPEEQRAGQSARAPEAAADAKTTATSSP